MSARVDWREDVYGGAGGQILREAEPRGAVQHARLELAAELVADLRRVDALLRETKKKLLWGSVPQAGP